MSFDPKQALKDAHKQQAQKTFGGGGPQRIVMQAAGTINLDGHDYFVGQRITQNKLHGDPVMVRLSEKGLKAKEASPSEVMDERHEHRIHPGGIVELEKCDFLNRETVNDKEYKCYEAQYFNTLQHESGKTISQFIKNFDKAGPGSGMRIAQQGMGRLVVRSGRERNYAYVDLYRTENAELVSVGSLDELKDALVQSLKADTDKPIHSQMIRRVRFIYEGEAYDVASHMTTYFDKEKGEYVLDDDRMKKGFDLLSRDSLVQAIDANFFKNGAKIDAEIIPGSRFNMGPKSLQSMRLFDKNGDKIPAREEGKKAPMDAVNSWYTQVIEKADPETDKPAVTVHKVRPIMVSTKVGKDNDGNEYILGVSVADNGATNEGKTFQNLATKNFEPKPAESKGNTEEQSQSRKAESAEAPDDSIDEDFSESEIDELDALMSDMELDVPEGMKR